MDTITISITIAKKTMALRRKVKKTEMDIPVMIEKEKKREEVMFS